MTDELRDQLQSALGATYSIERELGGGGMSRVFVANEISLNRKIVLKVLPRELAAAVMLDRFRREVQLAAQLQHPHILPLFSAGQVNGRGPTILLHIVVSSRYSRSKCRPI